MFRLCQTAKAHPCGEVKLKLEATGTFWMTPYCSCKVSQVPRWVWTAEYYLYMRWKCNGIQIRESTNWYAHSPLKDLGNANRRKYERKIEGFFFLLFPPYPSNPGSTDVLITDTVAAQIDDCLGLECLIGLFITLITCSHKGGADVPPS